nr:MAG TPA: hypothetical protein [Caudoviricetes sp.]
MRTNSNVRTIEECSVRCLLRSIFLGTDISGNGRSRLKCLIMVTE